MPETLLFRCPCCGQLAPIDRLEEGPFPLEKHRQTYGGKTKLTDEERMERKGTGFRRGSGRGRMDYEQLEVDEALRESFARRIEEVTKGGSD